MANSLSLDRVELDSIRVVLCSKKKSALGKQGESGYLDMSLA